LHRRLWSVSACHHAVTSVVAVMQLMFLPCLTMHITAVGFMAAACIHMGVLFRGHRDMVGQPHTHIHPLLTPTVWVSALGSDFKMSITVYHVILCNIQKLEPPVIPLWQPQMLLPLSRYTYCFSKVMCEWGWYYVFSPVVTALTIKLCSGHTIYLCVLCGSQNKQRLFHCTALTDWFV
jgi:hypothetical protein